MKKELLFFVALFLLAGWGAPLNAQHLADPEDARDENAIALPKKIKSLEGLQELKFKSASPGLFDFSRSHAPGVKNLLQDYTVAPVSMPNAYRGDICVEIPNAYAGDNAVRIPNVYQPDSAIQRPPGVTSVTGNKGALLFKNQIRPGK